MAMPNFLIIGAAKAGTSSLYQYLQQHPEIYMSPVKETRFFALEGEKLNFKGPGDQERALKSTIVDIASYQAQFDRVSGERAIGEASPIYLYSRKAPERIKHYIPNVRLIAILRNPIERAYSSYLHLVRDGRESCTDFSQALEVESQRIQENWTPIWHYKNMGFYYDQITHYLQHFNSEQLKVYLYEDLCYKELDLLQDLFTFIGVDPNFVPDTNVKHNVSGVPKNRLLHTVLTQSNPLRTLAGHLIPADFRKKILSQLKQQNLEKPKLDPQTHQELVKIYQSDILHLQDLIDRDLSHWLVY